jgi:hypothetical protein
MNKTIKEEIFEDCKQKYGVNIDFDTKYIYISSDKLEYNIKGCCDKTNKIVNLAFVRVDTMISGFGTNKFYSYTDNNHQVYFNMDAKVNQQGIIIVSKSNQFKLILTDNV